MSAPIKITDAEREWLREAAAILNGKPATLAKRKKAASVVRLLADRIQEARDRYRQA